MDPLVVKTVAIGLGLMFLAAAWHKAGDRAQFRVTLLEYQVLPQALVAPAAIIVPLFEAALGVSWLAGYPGTTLTAIASAALLGVYALAIGINLLRGRVHFDCGCGFAGKSGNEQYLSGGLVLRNAVLIALALSTLWPATDRVLGVGDYLTLLAALLAAGLSFAAANQLLANRAAINTWRKSRD
jgi:hypothetical protein